MQIVRGVPSRPSPSQAEEDIIEEKRQNRLRKAFATATDIGLSKTQRHELAQLLPGVDKDDGGSWKDLDPKQLHDLITMMEGWIYIAYLKGLDS